jgi:hypothetical protein
MTKRILLAGLLGGLALYAWETVAHLALPLGEAGVRALPNEAPVLDGLKRNIPAAGFYFFPAPPPTVGMTAQQRRQAQQTAADRMRHGPSGIMVVHPDGIDMISPRQLVTQFGSDVFAMLVAAVLIAYVPGAGFGTRLFLVALTGLFPVLRSGVAYWNWYGFPTAYLLAQATIHVVGALAGGLVLAALVKPSSRAASALAAS